jgi:hypothetical protein
VQLNAQTHFAHQDTSASSVTINLDMILGKACLPAALLLLAASGCFMGGQRAKETPETNAPAPVAQESRPAGVVGYYKLDDPAHYGAKSMNEVPIGQIQYLGIEKERWMLRDMMSAFGGPTTITPDGAMLTVKEGPSGPRKGNDFYKVKRSEKGLVLSMPGESVALNFTYVGQSPPVNFDYDKFLGPAKE